MNMLCMVIFLLSSIAISESIFLFVRECKNDARIEHAVRLLINRRIS